MSFRIVAIAPAGAALYWAGLLDSIVLRRPERPEILGAIAVVVAIGAALVLLAGALTGTGEGDALTPRAHTRLHRAVWLFACVMATVSLAWIFTMPRQHSEDWTPHARPAG